MNKVVENRFVVVMVSLAMVLFAGTAGAEVTFDTSKLESTATTVLGVGAVIAIGFAVFKIGKRAMNKV